MEIDGVEILVSYTSLFCVWCCRQLLKVALSGNSKNAEMILEEMERAGFLPGPRAFHALIVAYAKEGNGDGALHAIRRVFQQGNMPPLVPSLPGSFHYIGPPILESRKVCAPHVQ